MEPPTVITDGGMVITRGGAKVVEGKLFCEEPGAGLDCAFIGVDGDVGIEALDKALDDDPPILATLLLRPDRSTVHVLLPPPVEGTFSILVSFQSKDPSTYSSLFRSRCKGHYTVKHLPWCLPPAASHHTNNQILSLSP